MRPPVALTTVWPLAPLSNEPPNWCVHLIEILSMHQNAFYSLNCFLFVKILFGHIHNCGPRHETAATQPQSHDFHITWKNTVHFLSSCFCIPKALFRRPIISFQPHSHFIYPIWPDFSSSSRRPFAKYVTLFHGWSLGASLRNRLMASPDSWPSLRAMDPMPPP